MMTGLLVAVAIAAASAEPVSGNAADTAGTVTSAPLRGGVEGLRRALGDRAAMPPAMAVVELTRRFYGGTGLAADSNVEFSRFRAWLRECATTAACDASALPPDPVPLPGSRAFWRETGLETAGEPDALVLSILASRSAALLYTALLSMEPTTRAWFLQRPAFVRTLSETDRGALVVAAPYLRLEADRFHLPGGPAAAGVWSDVVGVAPDAQPAFVEALLRSQSGRLAYVLEVIASLSVEQQGVALGLATADSRQSARALVAALGRAVGSWEPGQRPFWRPSPDPAFLIAQIPVEPGGRLAMPGGRRFWEFVFEDDALDASGAMATAAWRDPEPLSPAWLVDQLASVPADTQVVRYEQWLFASRQLADEDAGHASAVATALRGYARFPPLVRTLERLGVGDAVRLAAMARHAEMLTRAGDDWRARASLAQWQATLALLDRMARTGTLATATLDATLASLSRPVPPATEAVWTTWLAPLVPAGAGERNLAERPVERALVDRITASAVPADRVVEWEGTAYRVDLTAAEADRLAKVRGRDSRPLIDAASELVRWHDVRRDDPAGETLKRLATLAAAAGVDGPLAPDDEFGRRAHEAASRARQRLVASREGPVTADGWAALRDLAEALATAGLVELTYAASMGWAEDLPLTAAAASRRHIFVRSSGADRDRRWVAPSINSDRRFPWHVSGSLLGLDVALAPIAMRRLSLRPLPGAPLLNTGDRAALVSTTAVLNPLAFSDEAQRAAQALIVRGVEVSGAIDSAPRARQAAAHANLSTLRTTLLEWQVASGRPDLPEFFSMTELLRIGLAGDPVPSLLASWGNYEFALTGRSAAGTLPQFPVERYAGRSKRMLTYAIPDLQLTLAVRLAEMKLPAVLVPALMAAASFDVVNTSPSRHTDDWQAVVASIRKVDAQAVERYLGLLTTSGPLRVASPGRSR
jgi:hypothetical protein